MRRFIITTLATAMLLSVGACIQDESTESQEADVKGQEDHGRNPDLIDRMGRPEITNFLLRVPFAKDGYNVADTFDLGWLQQRHYRDLISLGIGAWDKFDGKEDWHLFSHQSDLSYTLVRDYLIVDTSKACSVDTESYFEIEQAPLGEHQTCGGRPPNADVIDTLVTLLVGGPATEDRFGDGIDGVPRPAVDTFPYLVEPHPTPQPEDGGA